MKGGAVSRIEPVARIEGQEGNLSSLRKLRGLVHHEAAIVNAGLESHLWRIPQTVALLLFSAITTALTRPPRLLVAKHSGRLGRAW